MKTAVEGCRRIIHQIAVYLDLAEVLDDEKERIHYQDLSDILTPVCKAYTTDMGFKVAETAVQSMGGYGYMKEYRVEQYLRDLKVACIYEGSNGIQAIGLQRRELNAKNGRLFKSLIKELEEFIQQNLKHSGLGSLLVKLENAKEIMVDASNSFQNKDKQDTGLSLSVAKPFLDLCGHVICTWMLIKSAVVADSLAGASGISDTDRSFYQGKIFTARFAVANFLPQVDALAKTIFARDRSIIDMHEDDF